jgi:hypothetical protein
MSNSKLLAYAAGGIAAVVIGFGAYALGNSNSTGSTSGTANAARFGPPGQGGQPGQPGQGVGAPQNGQAPPGFGSPATGAAADKAKAAALGKYKGSVEQVMKLPDGSYVAHVITASGEYHVHVSKDFKVTGADQGGPRGGGPGGAPGGGVRGGGAPGGAPRMPPPQLQQH